MIEIERVAKRFTQGRGRHLRIVQAVDGVSFQAADARITGLLGPNGAGKTTTLRMLAGLLPPDGGRLRVDGIDVQRQPRAALARMGVLSDARGLYPRLTARENIVYYGRLHGMSDAAASQRADALAHMLDMSPLLGRRTEGFSQGERMKTALARALVHDPPNIVLDEPTNGLDVLATRALRDALRRLRDGEGKCIVFSTHIMQEVERLCDQVVVVAHGRTVAEGSVASLNALCGEKDFEESFVKLAFGANAEKKCMNAWVVFKKELIDALRDRRTLFMVLLSSVAIGPLVLVALSALVAGIEQRAEDRTVFASGIEHAPTLRNYLERQTYRIVVAPVDYESRLRNQSLGDPVLLIGKGFETTLARGELPVIEVVSSSGNQRAGGSVNRVMRLLRGFSHEHATLRLALRGISPATLEVLEIHERDLANPQARAAQFTGMLPFFVLMAVLYGALNAALDTTAGERERGSLEPLLMSPASRLSLVIGKWGAVAVVGMLIALLSCFSFLPAQGLLRSETLAAMFQFGLREVALFLALLAPLAAALAALLMAIAIRCKTYKEAQANNTVVVLVVSLLPLVTVFNQSGEAPWHLVVPALGQVTLMNRVLKGEAVGGIDVTLTLAVCALIAATCLIYVARQLRTAAIR